VEFGLRNRVALVTGASKGMGFATARAFAREGAKVLMVARGADALAEAAATIRQAGAEVETLAGDVTEPQLAARAVGACVQRWGAVHILVNNAGGPPMGTVAEQTDEAWNGAVQQNLMSTVRFCREALPVMQKEKWGRIVSITSTLAKEPAPAMVLSATTRSGVAAFTKAIALEYAPHNITANVVCPGGVLTDRLVQLLKARAEREKRSYDELLTESQASIPAKRFAQPEEIANVIVFLASDAGGYVNGVHLSVDGALTRGF
jgi:3-oxoacyl-[acyl-carrier protein] reductase